MNRYYVYFHKDELGNIRYVGHGSGDRAYSRSSRNKDHSSIINELEVVIYKDCLSKEAAEELEQELITEYFPSGLLLNKLKTVTHARELDYKTLKDHLYLSQDSRTYLKWKSDRHNCGMLLKPKDSDAGCFSSTTGYYCVRVNNVFYACHRVVYVLANKTSIPRGMIIDHIDRNRLNNSPNNLRLVTHHQNRRNVSVRKDSTTGVNGVQWDAVQQRFITDWRLPDGTHKRKIFNPRTLYCELDSDLAKELAFNDATEYRKEMEDLYYNNN